MGQAVLALAEAVRTGRGQGLHDCGRALVGLRTDFGKEHCIRSHAAPERSPTPLPLAVPEPLCPSRGSESGGHRCPRPWSLREGENTSVWRT